MAVYEDKEGLISSMQEEGGVPKSAALAFFSAVEKREPGMAFEHIREFVDRETAQYYITQAQEILGLTMGG